MVIHKRMDNRRFIDRRDACPTYGGGKLIRTSSLKIKDTLRIH